MELSVTAMNLCADKYGKGQLHGFENTEHKASDAFSKEEAESLYDELVRNEMIDLSEEGVHISALGQHILNMMINPEQFIMLENKVLDLNMKLYFRDAYYLLVMEDKTKSDRLFVRLLPGLKEVVSSFVYAVYPENGTVENEDNAVHVMMNSRNKNRKSVSDAEIYGSYRNNGISCRMNENNEEIQYSISEFVNSLTKWLFARLSETMEEK